MEDGFYKFEDGNWQYAPNFVYGPGYELLRENKDTYSYPVEGWSWYDNSPINETNETLIDSTDSTDGM
jgi:hypothetical protein